MTSWRSLRPSVRVASRELRRGWRRSLLAVLLIALPVFVVATASVLLRTLEVTPAEAPERWMGAADAVIRAESGAFQVEQGIDPDQSASWSSKPGLKPVEPADLRRALGRDVPLVELSRGGVDVEFTDGATYADVLALDTSDRLTAGLVRVERGRLPRAAGEVLINAGLADRGIGLGDPLTVRSASGERSMVRVVGVGSPHGSQASRMMVGLPRTLPIPSGSSRSWLVGGGDVTWDDVRALNKIGVFALSRAVLADPGDAPDSIPGSGGGDNPVMLAVVGMIVAMVLLEVVLLAGPAFAVAARRQERTTALMMVCGATPRQARWVVLAMAGLLGMIAAGLGVGLGVVVGWASVDFAARAASESAGPLDLRWLELGGVALFALLSAFLAAAVPAWAASRRDPVAVLGGRRGEPQPRSGRPLIGLALLGFGAVGAIGGAQEPGGDATVGISAVPLAIGMLLVVPALLGVIGRAAGWLPFPLRFAARDALRNRARTVPAVGAVAITVMGIVALGVGNASDAAQARATSLPVVDPDAAVVSLYDMGGGAANRDDTWRRIQEAVDAEIGAGVAREVTTVPSKRRLRFDVPVRRNESSMLVYGNEVVVADRVPGSVWLAKVADREAADRVLASGGVVLFSASRSEHTEAVARARGTVQPAGEGQAKPGAVTLGAAPAYVARAGLDAPAAAIVSPALVARWSLPTEVRALEIPVPLSDEREQRLTDRLYLISNDVSVMVDYSQDPITPGMVQLILGAGGGVLMLAGTLIATLLALSEARPDLATLESVGASPGVRRSVAASYALVVGGVGALLGALIGLIPGVAISFPLTSTTWLGEERPPGLPDHFLEIPWLLIGALVVALPLITAALVWATTRNRVSLATRLD